MGRPGEGYGSKLGREIVGSGVLRTELLGGGDARARRGPLVGVVRDIVVWEVPRTELLGGGDAGAWRECWSSWGENSWGGGALKKRLQGVRMRVSVGFGREVVGWGKRGPKNRGSKGGTKERGIGRWLQVVGWGKRGPKNRGSKGGTKERGIGRWLLERRSSR